MLGRFEYHPASSLNEALAILSENPGWEPIAGCTNTLVDARSGRHQPQGVVDLCGLEELRYFRRENGMIRVGPLTTLSDCANDSFFESEVPLLRRMAMEFAGPIIRNRATLGGNLAYASPAADSAPPLQALNAELKLLSKERGERMVKVAEFFTGPRSTVREQDELIVEIRIPAEEGDTCVGYHKFALRKAMAISVVSVAVVLKLSGDRLEDVSIALGAVAPVPYRVSEAEERLCGQLPETELIAEAAKIASTSATPISDVRASAEYRRAMVEVITQRTIFAALDNRRKA